MWICILATALLMGVVFMRVKMGCFQKISGELFRQMCSVMAISILMAGVITCTQGGYKVKTFAGRNPPGKGIKQEKLEVEIDGLLPKKELNIDILERTYTAEEEKELFEQGRNRLEKIVLGENKDWEKICFPLKLVTKIPDTPIRVFWQMNRYDLLDYEGNIIEKNLSEEGSTVILKATLQYRYHKEEEEYAAVLYPKERKGGEKILYELSGMIEKENQKGLTEERVSLPKEYEGRNVTWREKRENQGAYIILIGVLVAGLLWEKKRRKRKEEGKRRAESLRRAYPDLLNLYAMLLKAGMNTRQGWIKITNGFQTGKGGELHEEMMYTVRQIQGGISEKTAYEEFGRRCGVREYKKFAAMLSQNLTRGTGGMADMLLKEAWTAYEERKARAKRKGEEAGTKLLFPMFIMLGIVLGMIMVPAFFSVQI